MCTVLSQTLLTLWLKHAGFVQVQWREAKPWWNLHTVVHVTRCLFFIKDMIKLDNFKDVFKSALNMAAYFKNVHLANRKLELERKKLNPVPQKIKTFQERDGMIQKLCFVQF